MNVLGKLGYGAQVMLIGLCIVFTGLIIIIACIKIMALIITGIEKKKVSAVKTAVPATPEAPVSAPEVVAEPEADMSEVMAVIAAAIAAFDGNNGNGLVVRSVRRVSSGWGKAARAEQVYRF